MVNFELLKEKTFLVPAAQRLILLFDKYEMKADDIPKKDLERLIICHENLKDSGVITGYETIHQDVMQLRAFLSM